MNSHRSAVNTETFEGITLVSTIMSESIVLVGSDWGVLERVISGNDGGTDTFKSSSDHLSNGGEEFHLFVSGGSSSGVLLSEGGAHLDGEVQEVGVSVDLLFGLGNEEFLFKDALGHFFEMVLKLLLHSHKVSDGLFKSGLEGEISLLGSVFFGVVVSEGVLDVGEELVEHTSDSLDSGDVKEHIVLGSGHLGEHSDDWSVVLGKLDLDTGLEELFGVSGELDEGSFFSDEIVKEAEGTVDNGEGTFVIGDSSDVKVVTFFSSLGGSGKGGSGGGKVGDGVSEIDLGLISGLGAGGEMVGGSSEGRLTFGDFTLSEGLLFDAVSVVSGEHGIVLSLLVSDLVFELVEKSFDVGKWSTGLDLGLDLGEEVGEGWVVEGVQLSGLESEAGSDEAEEENSFHLI